MANTTGDITINNVSYKKSMKRLIGYVLQDDIFYTSLTVREQLLFTAMLRLPESIPRPQREDAVQHVIEILRMNKCANTTILLISGGEKKRCNIGTLLSAVNVI
jgi:ABC-type multidrug transport system ATPase subunit